jgi:hypothetical protein
MEIEEVKGLVIFMGIVGVYTFVLLGCMERRLKHIEEEDAKYVN